MAKLAKIAKAIQIVKLVPKLKIQRTRMSGWTIITFIFIGLVTLALSQAMSGNTASAIQVKLYKAPSMSASNEGTQVPEATGETQNGEIQTGD